MGEKENEKKKTVGEKCKKWRHTNNKRDDIFLHKRSKIFTFFPHFFTSNLYSFITFTYPNLASFPNLGFYNLKIASLHFCKKRKIKKFLKVNPESSQFYFVFFNLKVMFTNK